MNTYETVTEAVNELTKRGYTCNLNLSEVRANLPEDERNSLSVDDFDIDELYRFEGVSDPADETIMFAVSSNRFRRILYKRPIPENDYPSIKHMFSDYTIKIDDPYH
jgi:hypothetical protein